MDATDTKAAAERDVLLVKEARGGDRSAFGQLYAQYARMVHGILLAKVPHTDVDDLVQEVFFRAWRQLGKLRDPATFCARLAAIARNRANDYYRRRRDTEEISETMAIANGTASAAEARAALAAIQALPDTYRETLTLRLVEGLTGPEIAAATGLTHESVRVNLHRGMKLLRERLSGSASAVKEGI